MSPGQNWNRTVFLLLRAYVHLYCDVDSGREMAPNYDIIFITSNFVILHYGVLWQCQRGCLVVSIA